MANNSNKKLVPEAMTKISCLFFSKLQMIVLEKTIVFS